MQPVIAIIGRPNVGKSTLFNRLIGEKKAITDNISGVTRDRIYGDTEWNGKSFSVIDTGGFVRNSQDVFESAIAEQVVIALEEADAIIFMVDAATGITDHDEAVTDMLRKSQKKVFVAVNKVDNNNRMLMANEFWSLGFENTFFLAAISGSGTGELLDAICEFLPEPVEETGEVLPKFAIVGQPNAGKSSLANALLGEDRNIVTDVAGTTRDSINGLYNKFGKKFIIVDTAGIRKKAKVHENLEFYSVLRAIRAIEEADICLLMIDAVMGIESQDLSIVSLIIKRNKGMIILVNKWDLVKDKETNTARDIEIKIKEKLQPFKDVPIVFISALNKQRISRALDLAMKVYENRTRKIKTSEFNDFLQEVIQKVPPPSHRGKFVKIKYGNQLPLPYPAFAIFCNYPGAVKVSYKNYIENQIRERYDFEGVPMSIFFRQK